MNKLEAQWFEETFRQRCPEDKIPARLYKFLSPRSEFFLPTLEAAILRNQVWLSGRRDLNDVFDTQFMLDFPDSAEGIEEFVRSLAEKRGTPEDQISEYMARVIENPESAIAEISRSANFALDGVGICSMTESIAHPLMWAHYANSHKGIALIFRHGREDTFGCFPIRYDTEYPHVSIKADGIPMYPAFVKGQDWEYEREWRIANPSAARTYFELPSRSLEGVVLGARSEESTIDVVFELYRKRAEAGHPLLSIHRAAIDESFRLKFFQMVGSNNWKESSIGP